MAYAPTHYILKAGIAPPDLKNYPEPVRMMFWGFVVDAGLKRKDRELAQGLNAKGEPLPGVLPATRKHRRSEMTPSGKGDPSAPYLMPGRRLSRTRSLLYGRAFKDYALFGWRYDAHTGDQWGAVLAAHARRGKAYDVVGLSPAGIAAVAREAQKRWRQWLLGSPVQAGLVASRPQSAVAHGRPLGTTDLTHATFGIGATREQAQRAIDEGRSSGFRTQAEWQKYFRQKAAPIPHALAPSVRRGSSNVLLQHVWNAPRPPSAPPLARAAMPPTAPPRPRVGPTPRPVAPAAKPPGPIPSPPPFPPSTAAVAYGGRDAGERRRSEQAARRVLKGVPREEYASLVGAPDGAVVTFSDAGPFAVGYTVEHPSLKDMRGRIVSYDFDGTRWHAPDVLYVKESERGKGVGAEVHGRRVAYGAKHGLTRIAITAARGREEVGYVVWPIMGYDGKLPQSILDVLPDDLAGRTTIQDLLADEKGQEWWKTNGKSIDVKFDLRPGSASIARWTTYWARRSAGRPGR